MRESLIELFEDEVQVLEVPPPGARYMVVSRSSHGTTEIEFFSDRPVTVAMGGDVSNWPPEYQVWKLVEEDGMAKL